MSVLSNTQIVHARTQGDIIIEPFVPENVRKNSVDLTLGEWFYRGSLGSEGIYSPFDEDEVKANYVGPFKAKPYFNVWRKFMEASICIPVIERWPIPDDERVDEILEERLSTWSDFKESLPVGIPGVPADHPVIILLPREFILSHTHEFIGPIRGSVPEMRARSSWGRNRVSVCLCAGWGDTGYVNRWTQEVHNLSNRAIVLPVGERFSQLVFHETGATSDGTYGAETAYESKYQETDDIHEIISNWEPSAMLPRNYKDQRRRPLDAWIPPAPR